MEAPEPLELMKVPLLAEIPLDSKTREGGDNGRPHRDSATTRPLQTALFEKIEGALRSLRVRAEADTRASPDHKCRRLTSRVL